MGPYLKAVLAALAVVAGPAIAAMTEADATMAQDVVAVPPAAETAALTAPDTSLVAALARR